MGTHKWPANLPSPSITSTFISEHKCGRVSCLHCVMPHGRWKEKSQPHSSYLHMGLWANNEVLFSCTSGPTAHSLGLCSLVRRGMNSSRAAILPRAAIISSSARGHNVALRMWVLHTQHKPETGLTCTSHLYPHNSCGSISVITEEAQFLSPLSTSPTQPAAGSFATLSSRWLEADGGGHRVAFIFHLALPTFSSTPP